jgi:hypothetical protein
VIKVVSVVAKMRINCGVFKGVLRWNLEGKAWCFHGVRSRVKWKMVGWCLQVVGSREGLRLTGLGCGVSSG